MSGDTLPGRLVEKAVTHPNAVALRFFRRGKWNEVTFGALREKAARIGSALAEQGVKLGGVVAIIVEDSTLFLAAELGAQGIGAAVLALDPDVGPQEARAAVAAAGAVCVIAGDQEQFDKIDEARAEVPTVRLLVVDVTRGLRYLEGAERTSADGVLTMEQLERHGAPAGWDASAVAIRPDSPARVTCRGAVLRKVSHAEVIAEANRLQGVIGLGQTDTIYSLHSLADPVEHALAVAGPLTTSAVLHFGQVGLIYQGLCQVQPSIVHATPGWLRTIEADVAAQTARTKGLKLLALKRGLRAAEPATVVRAARHARPTRLAGIAAAALVFLFFLLSVDMNDTLRLLIAAVLVCAAGLALVLSGRAAGVPLRQHYGLSRCRAVLASATVAGGPAGLLGALSVPVVRVDSEVLR